MDNLTHSLVGALIGQAGVKRRTGLAMPALIIGANLPDIDAGCVIFGLESLAMRRGITHGPIAWVVLPLALAGLLWRYDRWQAQRGTRPVARAPVRFVWLCALAFVACLTHPALDWLNNYGIRLLEPFSSEWFYGDTLFIIDVWLWLGLGFATWFSLRREKAGDSRWRRTAVSGLATAGAYVLANGLITAHSEGAVRHALTIAQGHPPELVVANALPVAFWRREMLWRDGSTFSTATYSLMGGALPGKLRRNMLETVDLTPLVRQRPDMRAFLFWSRMPVIEHVGGGRLRLYDQRFSAPLGGDRFSFTLPMPGRDDNSSQSVAQ